MSLAEDRPTQLLIDARIARILNRVAEGSAIVVGVVGAAVLLGWVVGLDAGGALEPVFAVFPTTAFSLAAVGGALVIVCRGELHGLRALVVRVLGALVVLVTAAGLLYAFGGVGTTLGQAISHLPGTRVRPFPAPPPNSLVAMFSAGVMLLLFDTTWRGRHPARFFIVPSAVIALLGLAGGLYGIEELYRVSDYAAMPWLTSVCVLLVALSAFFSRSRRRFSSLFAIRGVVGDTVRSLVPLMFILPFLVGGLSLLGFERGLYDAPLAVALIALVSATLLVTVVLAVADQLRRAEALRLQAEGEMQRLNRYLAKQAIQLQQANEELEAFSYSVSHDLRAPLRSIDGFSQALLEDYEEAIPQEGQDYLRRVRAASQRMGDLIDGLLNLSRLSRATLSYGQVDLGRLAREKVDALRERDREREVTLTVSGDLRVRGDRLLLRALMDNLLENAWKFTRTRASATIDVGMLQQNGGHVYFVRDDGVGFDMAYADKLFKAFQRLHGPDQFEGTGVGLATCLRIVRRHGGRLWAEGAVEQGATFYFTLGS